MKNEYPEFLTDFESHFDKEKILFYKKSVARIASHIFPPDLFHGDDAFHRFCHQLPAFCWSPLHEPPFNLSFFLCCPFRVNASRFFYEMISKWLVPGKRLNVLLHFAADFFIPTFGNHKYTCCETVVRIETEKEQSLVQKSLPILETEIKLGVQSAYQGDRILEIKGLSGDEKTSRIQENIILLIDRRAQDFDYDILCEMQHFVVLCAEDFKAARSPRHMSRIICTHYLFRKALKLSLDVYPERRYFSIKLVREKLYGKKRVLGVIIAVSFIHENELFESKHVMAAIKSIVADAKAILGSYFFKRGQTDSICTLYLEIEKESGGSFSLEEERHLKNLLPTELKERIEKRLNPIFKPQNEEEVMRHILTLTNQLKYVDDLPQVNLDFNLQTEEALEFQVVLLRVVKTAAPPLSGAFENKPTFLEYLHDRTKVVGSIRNRYPKEANVFKVRIRKAPFLRKDHSVDIYRARQQVTTEMARLIGDFRDYNGGILAKEAETFEWLRRPLGREQTFLLENFFYSLEPAVMRSILPKTVIKKMFFLLMDAENEGLPLEQFYQIHFEEDENNLFILVTARDASFQDTLLPTIKQVEGEMATFFLPHTEKPFLGAIFQKQQAKNLKAIVERALMDWSEQGIFELKY